MFWVVAVFVLVEAILAQVKVLARSAMQEFAIGQFWTGQFVRQHDLRWNTYL
jgi:hypothetical protein